MLYQIYFKTNLKNNHAGSKAVDDLNVIANKKKFCNLIFVNHNLKNKYVNKIASCFSALIKCCKYYCEMEKNSVLLVQYPLNSSSEILNLFIKSIKKNRNVKIITLVHDVRELLFGGIKKYNNELLDMVGYTDIIIVHNKSMLNWFINNKGVSEEKLVDLQIFDYLSEGPITRPQFERTVTIAGNLSKEKAGYIYKLNSIENVTFFLYGPNYVGSSEKNVNYCGSVSPDILPSKLNKGFGLVWDGTSLDKCDGRIGEYLKYNNPHKLSLYISSGLPVFIWDKAAEAEFVIQNKIGFAISQIEDIDKIINTITEEMYFDIVKNVEKIGLLIRNGYYENEAIDTALERLSK